MGEPLPICFLNGDFMPLHEARISPLDRGFLYSDGAYEVTPVYGGRPFRFAQHHDRLTRSLREIRMEDPLAREAWRDLYQQLIARNAHDGDLYIYVQVTRGAENGRNHAPPAGPAAHRIRLRGSLARRPRRLARDRSARRHRAGHALGPL